MESDAEILLSQATVLLLRERWRVAASVAISAARAARS